MTRRAVTSFLVPAQRGVREVGKRVAEQILWGRVTVQRRLEAHFPRARPRPAPQPPTAVLDTVAQWRAATREVHRLRLPGHHDAAKNWDCLGALSTILSSCPSSGAVFDAGAARYSTMLPWLRLYGFTRLVGMNLEFPRESRHGEVRFLPGDITATPFADNSFEAITCLSVIEHGVPLQPFLAESARLLRPEGILVVSTDYDESPPDTTGLFAYGVPVQVFSPAQIQDFVAAADRHGLTLLGDLGLHHRERTVCWQRFGLHYTYLRLAFRRRTE